jgi:hypothetical protein
LNEKFEWFDLSSEDLVKSNSCKNSFDGSIIESFDFDDNDKGSVSSAPSGQVEIMHSWRYEEIRVPSFQIPVIPKVQVETHKDPLPEVEMSEEKLMSNTDFSKRQDVLGKTMVRSLKRYYLDLFNGSNNFKNYGQKSKNEQFYPLVKEFSGEQFTLSGKAEQAIKTHEVTMEDLTFFVGMMVSTAHIKKHVTNAKRKKDQVEFMSVIYSYSAKKIAKLAKNKTFQFLFEDFANSPALEDFMFDDKTLSKHPVLFRQTALNIISLWK